eukprot:gene29117-32333_t
MHNQVISEASGKLPSRIYSRNDFRVKQYIPGWIFERRQPNVDHASAEPTRIEFFSPFANNASSFFFQPAGLYGSKIWTMPKQIIKSTRPVTAHAIADNILDERRCHKSINSSLNKMLAHSGEHQSEYNDIPDDLDVESSAPSKENCGYSSRNLMDRQAELQLSGPQGPAAPPSYYGGNKEEDDDDEDEEANHVGMYRTRLNVRRKSLVLSRAPSQSAQMMTGDEAVEAITKEGRLADAAKIEALNAAEESKRKKEWETMWQANSGTWLSPNFIEGLGDSNAPSDSKVQPKYVLGPPPMALRRGHSRRASVCSLACDERDGNSLLPGVQMESLGDSQEQSQDLVLHSNIQAQAKAQAQAQAQYNLPRTQSVRRASQASISHDSMYSYGCDSLPGSDASCPETQGLSIDSSFTQTAGATRRGPRWRSSLSQANVSLPTSAEVPVRRSSVSQTHVPLPTNADVPLRRSSVSQTHVPIPTNADIPLRHRNSLVATHSGQRLISGSSSKSLLSFVPSPVQSPTGQPLSNRIMYPENMRGDKANRRKSVVFCGADSGNTTASGSNSSLPAGSQLKQKIAKAAADAELVAAFNRTPNIVGPNDPTNQSELLCPRRSVTFNRPSSAVDHTAMIPKAPSPESALAAGTDADVNDDDVVSEPLPNQTLASRFARKLRLLTGRVTVNDRSCSDAPEPHSPTPPSNLARTTHSEQLRGFTGFTAGTSPMARRRPRWLSVLMPAVGLNSPSIEFLAQFYRLPGFLVPNTGRFIPLVVASQWGMHLQTVTFCTSIFFLSVAFEPSCILAALSTQYWTTCRFVMSISKRYFENPCSKS